ncbi:MAG TPA: amidohydrolase [Candidatus Xenobia bacterium]|jgi:hypothetical protein
MLVEGERIVALGSGPPPAVDHVVDLGGRTVLPGFIDSHVHLLFTGMGQSAAALQGATTPAEVCDRMRAAPAGRWARGFGFDLEMTWEGLPEDRPALLERIDHHSAVVNRRAATLLADDGIAVSPQGRVSGLDFGRTLAHVYRELGEDVKLDALRQAARNALRQGVTTIHALEGGHFFSRRDLELVVEHDRDLGPRLLVYPQVPDVAYVRSLGLPRLGGCLLLDGSLGSRTARLEEPYADAPQERGLQYLSDEDLQRLVGEAHRHGLQLAFHAIGDAAVRQAVEAYRTLGSCHALRHRIEHCELASPGSLETIAHLGIHLGIQPQFEALWGGPGRMYEQRLGAPRMARTNPFRWYLDHAIPCGGGSDSDVTPLDPLLGIQAATSHPRTDQRLSVDEAIELFTAGSARLGHDENRVGTLQPGLQADFVVLGEDPHAANRIADIPIDQVWVAGRQVV